MKKHILALMTSLTTLPYFSYAWEGHTLLTVTALHTMPELKSYPAVAAEPLESFLQKEKMGLIKLLNENEKWSIKHIDTYPALPKALAFDQLMNQEKSLKAAFVQSIRINPTLELPLYVQKLPDVPKPINRPLPKTAVMKSWIADSFSIRIFDPPVQKIEPGEKLTPLVIIATAADEPDYGLDVELWKTNNTWFGNIYHWGNQPFGNPNVSFSSQAAFHMGFFYEPKLIYMAQPSLKRTYIEYRIHSYLELSKFAFQTGHPYWGYRFLGWALHYIQDLSQPYHSTSLPNVGLLKMIYAHVLYLLNNKKTETDLIQLVTNKHFALENYLYTMLEMGLKNKNPHDFSIAALTDLSHDQSYPTYSDNYPRRVIAKESNEKSAMIDKLVQDSFPARYTQEPEYHFYTTQREMNLAEELKNSPDPDLKILNTEAIKLYHSIGSHTRNAVRYVINQNNLH